MCACNVVMAHLQMSLFLSVSENKKWFPDSAEVMKTAEVPKDVFLLTSKEGDAQVII